MSDCPTWRVGFLAAVGKPAWYQRLLRRGYAHCWGALRLAPDLWQWVEWTPERLLLGWASDEMVARASDDAHLLLELPQRPDQPHPARPILALQHCAAIVSHAIGLRPRPWVTPYGLACAMRAAGARVIGSAESGGLL